MEDVVGKNLEIVASKTRQEILDNKLSENSPNTIFFPKDEDSLFFNNKEIGKSIGDKIVGTINLSTTTITNLNSIANALEDNELIYYLISDSSGSLPSIKNETHYNVNSSIANSLGQSAVNVGDLLAIVRLKTSLISFNVFRVIPLNDAKAPSDSKYGTVGLVTPWDKQQINKISNLETNTNNALSKIDSSCFRCYNGTYNMNNCLWYGYYMYCNLGRPAGSVDGEQYLLRVANAGIDNEKLLIDQTCFSCLDVKRVFRRILKVGNRNDLSSVEYSDWKPLFDSNSGIIETNDNIEDILNNNDAKSVQSYKKSGLNTHVFTVYKDIQGEGSGKIIAIIGNIELNNNIPVMCDTSNFNLLIKTQSGQWECINLGNLPKQINGVKLHISEEKFVNSSDIEGYNYPIINITTGIDIYSNLHGDNAVKLYPIKFYRWLTTVSKRGNSSEDFTNYRVKQWRGFRDSDGNNPYYILAQSKTKDGKIKHYLCRNEFSKYDKKLKLIYFNYIEKLSAADLLEPFVIIDYDDRNEFNSMTISWGNRKKALTYGSYENKQQCILHCGFSINDGIDISKFDIIIRNYITTGTSQNSRVEMIDNIYDWKKGVTIKIAE